MDDLFGELQDSESLPADAPLAARMRPRTLEEYAGQSHILGQGKLLRRAIEADILVMLNDLATKRVLER